MGRGAFLLNFSILIMIMFVHHPTFADPLRCEKVVMSGEPDFPPFSYVKQGELVGVGVDLGKLIFNELNIPVETRYVPQTRDLKHLLRRAHVDLQVASYDIPRYEKLTRKILPPYYEDTIALMTLKDKGFMFADWRDLMGKNGLTTEERQLGRTLNQYAKKYLAIDNEGDLRTVFRKLARGDYDYAIGSAQLLKMGMKRYDEAAYQYLPWLVSTEDLYFGISEASSCVAYAPYFRDRIQQLKDDGVVEALIQKHLNS